MVGNFLDLAQGGDGAVQITGVPQDDRGGDEKVQAGGAMLLIFVVRSRISPSRWIKTAQ
jgi:hypothetical protein